MPIDVSAFARIGAQARLAELEREVQEIHIAFPELRGVSSARRGHPKRQPPAATTNGAVHSATVDGNHSAGRSPAWSDAQRLAVGRRMRRYWAERKAAEAASTKAPAEEFSRARPGRKRALSPAARARISAAQKKRWAAHRAAKSS